MNPLFHTDLSISDSLKNVRKSVLIYETIIITIPKHEPIKKIYVEMVRQIVESEAKNDEDAE